jgi:hypothetical protein
MGVNTMENIVITLIMLISGGYIVRRLYRSTSPRKTSPGCNSCSSQCGAPSTAPRGEVALRTLN